MNNSIKLGGTPLHDRAKERLRATLRERPDEPILPEETIREPHSIVHRAVRELVRLV